MVGRLQGVADYVDTYKAMEECQKKGKAKAIGVSNFSMAEMERLVKETSIVSLNLGCMVAEERMLTRSTALDAGGTSIW